MQSALLGEIETVVVALITSDLTWSSGLRVDVAPTEANGLPKPSQVMLDVLATVPLARIGGYAGVMEGEVMERVDTSLRLFFGL